MKYAAYAVEDFLTEDTFLNYCLGNDQKAVLYWEHIRNTYPELEDRILKARTLFFLLAVKVDPLEKQQELNKLKMAIDRLEENSPAAVPIHEIESPEPIIRKLWFQTKTSWITVAAAIVIAIGTYALLDKKEYGTTIPAFAASSQRITIKTAYNERKTITLTDGSKVTINGLTELKLDPNYNEDNRILWLSGEAFFEVAKDKEKPFIVITGKTATTALGTSFKINNYSRRNETSVMLNTGKVSVGTIVNQQVKEELVLSPGEQVDISADAGKLVKTTFNRQKIDDWNNRNLVFSKASLQEIKSLLRETYGIEITAKNEPKKPIAFTGKFYGKGLTEVLSAIGFSNHFTYVIIGDSVELSFVE
ncbi:FecR domain-containing protein [Pedobacter gandavensis]|uniref:FecR family protein n=1 Tax=Pedobacter gandavensis TaxID=2679963 RepID=UPI002478A208|nr:FecR family protein [Pedobacter gandavensis]WGQ07931.1 FecR domain-containing protein [Pedobacter gandavensis]